MMSGLRHPSLRFAFAAVAVAMICSQALAAPRVALVIGNASYAHAPALANPLSDAADVGAALGRLGFEVTRLENADRASLWRGLKDFALAASASEVAVVFYAGHGIEVDQRNFLVPVDARLASDQDVEFEAVPLELVSRAVERASGLRLVILDACRENPFAMKMQRSGATRSIGRGLARVAPPGETLVAYAAKEGTLAADGDGRNSPYSEALIAYLEEPGLEVGLMFRKVRDAVLASTGGRQEPFVYGSLSSRGAYLAGTGPTPASTTASSAGQAPAVDLEAVGPTTEQQAKQAYEAAERINTVMAFKAVVRRFPESIYADLSRAQIEKLSEPEAQAASVATASAGAEPGSGAVQPAPSVDSQMHKRLEEVGELSTPAKTNVLATAKQEPSSIVHRIPDFSILHMGVAHFVSTGTFTGADGSRYEGEHLYGEAQGRGTYTWADGARYKGRFRNGKMDGRGTYTSPDGRARTCEWRNNKLVTGTCQYHGALAYNRLERLEAAAGAPTRPEPALAATPKEEPSSVAHRIPDFSILHMGVAHFVSTGTFTGADGSRYEGEHLYGEAQGRGTYTWADGARYKGRFRNGKMDGRGTYTSPDGRAQTCEWRSNSIVGATCEYH